MNPACQRRHFGWYLPVLIGTAALLAPICGCGGNGGGGNSFQTVNFTQPSGSYSATTVTSFPPPSLGPHPLGVSLSNTGDAVIGTGGEEGQGNVAGAPYSLWQNGLTSLPAGFAFGQVSDAGAVIENPTSGTGGTYSNGQITTLPLPVGFTQASAQAISGSGDIAGVATGSGTVQAFLWKGSAITSLGLPASTVSATCVGINNSDEIIGRYTDSAGLHLFLWNNGVLTDLGQLNPVGIGNNGEIVGETSSQLPAVWSSGKMSLLPVPGRSPNNGVTATVVSINSSGEVVGFVQTGTGDIPTLWSGGKAFNLTSDLSASGLTVGQLFAINDSGQILAEAGDNNTDEIVIMMPQPRDPL
ncbi:MAG TPA: hypothetical protein VFW40_14415 [Capsulimonadaceae bacterium]|nr:hypothetical protein [Capsulimonadaceae bacterium]